MITIQRCCHFFRTAVLVNCLVLNFSHEELPNADAFFRICKLQNFLRERGTPLG